MNSIERKLEQAEFYHAVAESAANPGARACFQHIARSYEVLAESQVQLEQLAEAENHLRQLYRPLPAATMPPKAGGGSL
jgi:hypothetical protein